MTETPNSRSTLQWINDDLDVSDAEEFITSLAERLVADGVPVGRLALLLKSQHPTLMGRTFLWNRGKGVTLLTVPAGAHKESRYLESAIYRVFELGETVRRRICDDEGLEEFNLLRELKEEGATDYLAQPLKFISGSNQAVTWTCFEPGGFSDRDIDILNAIQVPVARLSEICTQRHTTESLLNTYVGPGTGARILEGRHHLGDSELIQAVVCFCDLRGSVRLAEHYGTGNFLDVLNEFYRVTAQPVQDEGGEILRFIGDAFLAIFPISGFGGQAEACAAALRAVQNAKRSMEKENGERLSRGDLAFDCGFGLDIGEVLYGNIGTPERLEFTVIGPTANETARIESKCRDLGEPILVSAAFAAYIDRPWRDFGHHSLKNVSEPVQLLAPG